MTSSEVCYEINLILSRLPSGTALQAAGLVFLGEYRRDVDALKALGNERGIARVLHRTYRRRLLAALRVLERQTSAAGKGVQDA